MTRRLLAFSRREVIQPVVLDPGVAIRALAPLLEGLVGPPVRLVLDAPIGAGAIRMDPTHFDQILINIAANARDAMPDGGTLIVRVESGPGTTVAEAPSISASGGHGWLVLTMTDTGTGMTPETREHIFDPFFTTKDPDRGTGLGLATVHGVVHQAGGTITVDSSCGTGSSFRILLPLCELASSSGRPTIASTYRLPGSPVVMLALQDAAVQTLAARILERAGGSVIVAADGRIAIDLAGATTRIDVLIVDSVPRDAISPSIAQAISVLHPLARIVYVTDPSLGQAGEVRPADPTGVGLTIPFTADHLVARVRERSMHAAIGTKIGRASPTDEAVRPDATPKRTARVRSTAGTGSSRRGRRRPG